MGSTETMPATPQTTDDVAPFEFHPGSSPLIVAAPHVGMHIPGEIATRMNATGLAVRETDFHVHRLFDFARDLGAATLFATHSRYVIDLNRDPAGASLYPGRFETGLCPRTDFDRNAIYHLGQEPDNNEVQRRLQWYWRPYHHQLRAALNAATARHGFALLIDAHSIRATIPSLFDGRLPDLNFGTDSGRTLGPEQLQALEDWRSTCSGYSHVLDGRFKGGYTTRHYGDPARNIHALQIEIVQDTYLDTGQPHLYDAGLAAPLSLTLRPLVEALCAVL